jgi:exosortase B
MANASDLLRAAPIYRVSNSWPLLIGLATLYLPTLYDLAIGIWSSEAYAHGPIILLLSLWLITRRWQVMRQNARTNLYSTIGWVGVLLSLLLYIVGRAQGILMFEVGSAIILLAAITLITHGHKALRIQWFPLFFLLFIIPLPGSIVDLVTLPMKTAVSYGVEQLLFAFNYPIARSGVILYIGQYQLLVADACAGMQTLLTLEALGIFYLNVIRHTSPVRNIALAAFIVPISLSANIIRVVILTLITYYFGDQAGQGFLHGFAGMLLFLSALLLIISTDSFLQFLLNIRKSYKNQTSVVTS